MSILRFMFIAMMVAMRSDLIAQDTDLKWTNGAIALRCLSGESTLEVVGGEMVRIGPAESFHYSKGGVRFVSQEGSVVVVATSNDLLMLVESPGFFAIERFEQAVSAGNLDQSRTILNLREGLLVVDNRLLPASSKLVIETPVGRLAVNASLWFMRLEYDERSRIFDFSIGCADGVVRFIDTNREIYELRAGQRLAGAGSSASLSIEIGEIGEIGHDVFNRFEMFVSEDELGALDTELFREHMKPLSVRRTSVEAVSFSESVKDGLRPILIEYAPRAAPVIPYRGVTKKPKFFALETEVK